MKQKRPSITDISKALNVSITTISFVLNGKGEERKISKEVIEKIEKYAEKINYRPNQVAQSLRTGKSKILVFMVEDIGNSFFAKIARIIEEIAYKKDYKVLFCSNENNDERSRELITVFHERQVDGFIIIPSAGIEADIQNLIKAGKPVVLGDRYFQNLPSHYVTINNYDASKNGTKHLIANNYKNIAFITIDTNQIQMLDRTRGYEDAVKEAGLPSRILRLPFDEINKGKGFAKIETLVAQDIDLDAVFFSTNYLTQGALEIIKNFNPQLIAKLGILTFDDNEFFRINTPSISAVAQPLQEMAEEMMRIMFKLLKSKEKEIPLIQTVLDAKLIPRDSSLAKK
ncbi:MULTISPECIES: LacI family DNA-binding transcriptional regulator [unclassified Leeuwenhoekiella]|uniref:LacI family DNA-binding transcriptional regulator n=1 Tax=unclassified Leeuwenhoekiella TaxID=2615029 RepID=UPI000C50F752|nr:MULTISPECIES: LacI family DNA-binding transcriptional regulator [unclassified Leeuwenhoekiella]MAW95418.1 LacI family transcriptional regulator [Leeuwenhoekiella sp.]MBA80805.1 LacI family transcriptional regulator [Leeuwenhoekiella sp.]|tara:strand:+ start:1666 stop:2694 length:1029 start_codon:yes stop_codon:yes gene_type:complete